MVGFKNEFICCSCQFELLIKKIIIIIIKLFGFDTVFRVHRLWYIIF